MRLRRGHVYHVLGEIRQHWMGYSPLFIRLQDGLSEALRDFYQINVAVTIDLRRVRHEVVRDFMYVVWVDARPTTIRWKKNGLMELDPSQS